MSLSGDKKMTRREIVNVAAATPVALAVLTDQDVLAYARPVRDVVEPDAELRRFEREWQTKLAAWLEADRRRSEASKLYVRPEEPDAVFWRDSDAELWDANITVPEIYAGKLTGRSSYLRPATLTGMRVALGELRSEGDFFLGKSLRERRVARLEEILHAHDAWRIDLDRAWRVSGMAEVENACDAAYADMCAARRQIVFCNSSTTVGMQIKIRTAIWCFGETPVEAEDSLRDAMHSEELGTGEALACSILLDIMRLTPAIVA